MFDTVAIAGLGLIGGSLGMALRRRKLARRVVALVRRGMTLEEGREMEALDDGGLDPACVADAELVVLCAPVRTIPLLAQQIGPHLAPGALVTDVGSTKAVLAHMIPGLLPEGVHFLGGHPMAGSEQTGVLAAQEALFEGATWVLTPTTATPIACVARMQQLIRALGARDVVLDPEVHDRAVARISHLPHVVAAALATTAASGSEPPPEVLRLLAAGGFRDTTRIAGGSPEMWRDICVTNREALLEVLREFEAELAVFRAALEADSADTLFVRFAEARAARAAIFPPAFRADGTEVLLPDLGEA